MNGHELTLGEKVDAIRTALSYRPALAATILILKMLTALVEGVGLAFLLPILEFAMADDDPTQEASQFANYFFEAYELIGIEPTLTSLILGVAAVMTFRFSVSFLIGWLQAALTMGYMTELRTNAYQNLLEASVGYVDERDDDEIINTVVTETHAASSVISNVLGIVEKVFFGIVYAALAFVLSPLLTVFSVIVLGGVAFLTRFRLDAGYEIGDKVATANERIQGLATAATRGRREIKLFNMDDQLQSEFTGVQQRLADTKVALERNQVALKNFNQLLNAFVVFALVFLAIESLALGFATLATFLFAMYRLSPIISNLNNSLYSLDGSLPHLVRAQGLRVELGAHCERSGAEPAPNPTTRLSMNGVSFRYDDEADGTDVTDVSLAVERGETIALAGPSGAGKSTIVSLLARLYEPDAGDISANDINLERIDRSSWYDRVTVVPQQPFLFNGTLRENVAIGAPEADEESIERACELAQVSSFLPELPDGLETDLGDDGVRLSGGQRQRIAIARALLTDADILILDEATSELDSPTEEAIIDGIESIDREYATIVIGHWLSTVRNADRIYTVVDGEIVESGTHRELIRSDSAYADLYEAQVEPAPPS